MSIIPKKQIITETPIKESSSNGGRTKTIVFTNEKFEQFQITIRSESYVNQSYARLSKWSDSSGWNTIVSQNPKTDYNIDISYKSVYSPTIFDPIIKSLYKISKSF